MEDKDKTYDCLTCPYPRHKTPDLIFCDVCIRKIMDEHYDDKRTNSGKEDSNNNI